MGSLITARLYNTDGTPKTGIAPKLSAIRQSDKVEVLDSVDMEEVGNGFYQYEFPGYDKAQLYFFSIDSEQYDSINKLDSYGNKNTYGRDSLFLDTEAIAKEVWSAKSKEHNKPGTMGEVIQTPISFADIIVAISEIQSQAQTLAEKIAKEVNDNTILAVKAEVSKIKIPEAKEIDYEKIEEVVEEAMEEYMKPEEEVENEDELEKEDEEEENEVITTLNNLAQSVSYLTSKVEGMTRQDLVEGITGVLNTLNTGHLDKMDSMGGKIAEDINILKKGIMNLSAKLDK